MRWVMFIPAAVILLTFQSTIAPRVELFGARPDWLLVTVVFLALHARERDAALGAWMIGGCADLMTLERFGLIALSYLLVAMAVLSVREYLFRHHWVTQFVVTLIACLAVRSVWIVYRRFMYAPADSLLIELMKDVALSSVYTAAWVPLLHRSFRGMRKALGLTRPRYTQA